MRITGKTRFTHLPEDEGLLVVDGVESIGGHKPGPELFPDGVGGQAVHVHFDVGADFLVGEELARDDAHRALRRDHTVHGRLSERIERLVRTTHEVRLQQVPVKTIEKNS